MPAQFDAKSEAGYIERIAKAEIDGRVMGPSFLGDALDGFTKDQVKAIDAQLQFDNHIPNSYPHIELKYDNDGNPQSLVITPSFFDSDAQAAMMVIGIGKSEDPEQ